MTGGGQGMQTRLYGLASDQMTAIDVVLASGVAVTATATNSYSDLFWALRGAGSSSFGVVTRFTVNIFKVPQNAVFSLAFQKSIRILQLWQTFFVNSPNELNAYLHIQGDSFDITGHYLGTLDNLKTILAPILGDSVITWSLLKSCTLMEARSYVRGGENMASTAPIDTNYKTTLKSKSEFIGRLLPDAVLQTVVNILVNTQYVYFGSHLLGGNGVYSTLAADATAYPFRDAWYCVEYGTWVSYATGTKSYNDLQGIQSAFAPYSSGKYYNWLDLEFPISSYFGSNIARLMNIKAKYDPGNFFNGPLMVPLPPPAALPTAIPLTPFAPTLSPSTSPTKTKAPTGFPSSVSTSPPSSNGPTIKPSVVPSTAQTASPTIRPSAVPVVQPSWSPSTGPTRSTSTGPTRSPSKGPTMAPSTTPTAGLTAQPSYGPTVVPSAPPTGRPTFKLTNAPSSVPSAKPKPKPTVVPSKKPTSHPTLKPTFKPTIRPVALPTKKPTMPPTRRPSKAPSV